MSNIISNVFIFKSKLRVKPLKSMIHPISILFYAVLLLILTVSAEAQESKYVVNKYSLPREYNNSELFDLVRDKDGFVFLATAAGLMEWDGHSFRVYNSVNTKNFLSDRVQNLYLTSTNDLWLFGRNRYITLKEGDEFETFVLPRESGPLQMFLLDENELPWVLTNSTIYRYNSELRKFESFNDLTGLDYTHMIALHPSGTKIFLTDSGFWEYGSEGLNNIVPRDKLPVEPKSMRSIYFTDDNRLIAGHLNGYFSLSLSNQELLSNHIRFNERVSRFVKLSDDEVIAFSNFGTWNFTLSANDAAFSENTNQQNISLREVITTKLINDITLPLVASHGGSLNISGGNRVLIDRQIMMDENDRPRFVYTDSENTFWVGTLNGSIYHFREKSISTLMSTNAGEIYNAYTIVEALDQSMWYGCMNNGVFRERNGVFTSWNTENSSLTTNAVRYVYQNPADSAVYVALYHDGLWRFNDNDWVAVKEIDALMPVNQSVIEAMYYDPLNNRLLVGSSTMMLINDSLGWRRFQPPGAENLNNIKAIRPSAYGELFIATLGNGITLLDSTDTHIWTITTDDGLASNYIRDIYFQSADTLWIATENNGVNRLILGLNRKIINIKHLSISDGLSNSRTHRIISDEFGYLWISSNYGIMASNVTNLNKYVDGKSDYLPMYYVDEYTGMLNPEANGGVDNAGIRLSNGQIAIPTQVGITLIDPGKTLNIDNQASPRPIIREIRSYSRTFKANYLTTLTLPKGERDFTAFFQAPLFNDANYKIVRYKLNGVDQEWRRLSSNFDVWYSRINPGTYTLDVQIIVPYGTPEQTSLAIVVPSYLYERLWFQIMAFIGGISLIVLGTRYGYGKKLEIDEIRRLVNLQTKALIKLNEEKSRFFASITHELKTPISIIMGNVDIIIAKAQEDGSSVLIKPVKAVQRNSYKLLVLTDTLLGIAKLQNKQVKLGKSPVNIVQATELIVEEILDLLTEKKLSVEWKVDPQLDFLIIEIDLQAWERIIVNLVSNAINYSPVNGTITIAFRKEEHLIVEVTDEGPGISENDTDNIFDYLSQGTVNKNIAGTGLGLFLVKELVSMHDGFISVYNKTDVNKGACFRIELPVLNNSSYMVPSNKIELLSEDQSTNIQPGHKKVADAEHNPSLFSQLPNLLIVEDSHDYIDYIVSGLESNYRITCVDSASKALIAIENEKPDLIISDVMMPNMSGFELIKTIRQMDGCATIPVIFVTALDSDSDTHTGLSAGADAYLTKPVKHQVLKAQIQALLRREQNSQLISDEFESSDSEFVTNIKMLIYRHMGNKNLSIDMIADALFISRATLYRKWGEENNLSIQQYILQVRLKEALALMRDKRFNVTDAATFVGFSNSRYFSTVFKKYYGFTPSQIPREK